MALVLGLSALVGVVTAGTIWLIWSLLERMVASRAKNKAQDNAGKEAKAG